MFAGGARAICCRRSPADLSAASICFSRSSQRAPALRPILVVAQIWPLEQLKRTTAGENVRHWKPAKVAAGLGALAGCSGRRSLSLSRRRQRAGKASQRRRLARARSLAR